MPLTIGTQLGSHEITALLGKGGMGEVYRARDLKLKREVAIKILPPEFAQDIDRISRFQREAEVLASLNHPNIANIYDLEEQGGSRYLVLELVEGETLADRIARGPIPVGEALKIAKQICQALEGAHEKGIIHRDLKPANVKLTPDGKIKVLDFGLAKAQERESPDGSLSNSPTISTMASQPGVILGTPAYMSPEQARGKMVDKRADIWAFGVILHEMLTGHRLFEGETVPDTLAAVLEREPDVTNVPAKMRPLLRACLKKDPNQRLHDIADAMLLLEIEDVQATAANPGWLWPALAAAGLLGMLILGFLHFRETKPLDVTARFEMTLPYESFPFGTYLALSPDGRYLAFTATEPDGVQRLWLRAMEAIQPRMIPGTDDSVSPFWSPDSKWLGFVVGGQVKKVEVTGNSPPVTVAEVPNAGMGAWNKDGIIVFGNRAANGGLTRVAASGGALTKLTSIDPNRKEIGHSFPAFLPDGKHFVYIRSSSEPSLTGIFIGSIDMKPEDPLPQMLVQTNYGAVFVASPAVEGGGWLLYLRGSTLMAQPFDVNAMKLLGEPLPIAESVGAAGSAGFFSASPSGALAYRPTTGVTSILSWFDRQGKPIGTLGGPEAYSELAISPDGSQVAAFRRDRVGEDLWLIDVKRASSARLTTDKANESYPVWSPDGIQIVFGSNRNGTNVFDLYRKSAGVSGQEELFLKDDGRKLPLDWSRDGRFLLYLYERQGQKSALWYLPIQEKEPKPVKYLATQFNESNARFSPDGRWVVYASDISSRSEVYVSSFPDATAAPAVLVSTEGGRLPRWRRDGKALYYLSLDSKLTEVEVTPGSPFKVGVPKALFEAPVVQFNDPAGWPWDVTDDQRFLFNTKQQSSPPVTVVINWQASLKK